MSEVPSTPRPRCIHLWCKSMMVYGEAFENDPDFQSGQVNFWCVHTSKGLGPDGNEVSLEECCNPERTCFQEF